MGGVCSHPQHLKTMSHQGDAIAIAHRDGLQGNTFAISSTGHHLGLGPSFQESGCSADVVGVVMGLQDGHKLQLPLIEPGRHRFIHRRVDHHRFISPDQDPDHVVLQDGKRVQRGSHR